MAGRADRAIPRRGGRRRSPAASRSVPVRLRAHWLWRPMGRRFLLLRDRDLVARLRRRRRREDRLRPDIQRDEEKPGCQYRTENLVDFEGVPFRSRPPGSETGHLAKVANVWSNSRFAAALATRMSRNVAANRPIGHGRCASLPIEDGAANSCEKGAPMQTVIIIPARMAATRLPGKPLAEIGGKPMIVHVLRRAEAAGSARCSLRPFRARSRPR